MVLRPSDKGITSDGHFCAPCNWTYRVVILDYHLDDHRYFAYVYFCSIVF